MGADAAPVLGGWRAKRMGTPMGDGHRGIETSDARQQRRVERISQAAIEVRVPDATAAFADLRTLLLQWLERKAGAALPDNIRRGDTGELNTIGVQRVETAALDDPRYWTARQDDQDANLPRRTWITEAALAPRGGTQLLIGHRLHCVTLGDPAPFSRSIPRFMRDVARRYDTFLDDSEIHLTARRADTEEDAEHLARLLTNPNRRHPVIGISSDPEFLGGPDCLIDPDKLANEVFGVAHVWVIGRAASFALSDQIGRDLSVFHGGVRSWRFPLTLEDSGFSHPLALARRIAVWGEAGPEAFHRELADWALRFSAGRRDAEQLLPSFAEARQFAARLAREKAAAEGKSEKELLDLALSENTRLTRELEDQRAEHAEILALSDADAIRLQSERDEALAELANLRLRIEALEAALRHQRHEEDVPIPESLADIGDWAARYLGDGVVLLPRAVNAAKKSPFENVPFVYRTLLAIRDKYVPMRRTGDPKLRAECEATWQELGLALTPSFAGSNAGQFGDEYRVRWNGRNRIFDMHLKGSSSRDSRYGFRCYFFWDDEAKAVVIGSLPGHLTTNAT